MARFSLSIALARAIRGALAFHPAAHGRRAASAAPAWLAAIATQSKHGRDQAFALTRNGVEYAQRTRIERPHVVEWSIHLDRNRDELREGAVNASSAR
jgi:hypothetical protein